MLKTRTTLLFTGLLYLTCLPSGLSEPEGYQPGAFRMTNYSEWLWDYKVNLVNYVAEVGTNVIILSPITPAPTELHWFSLNIGDELPRPVGKEVGHVGSTYLDKFEETYNTSWHSVFKYDKLNRWLRIRNVQRGFADLFRVFVEEHPTEDPVGGNSTEEYIFDVAITLMTFEEHKCGFTSKPQIPKEGDTLILSCSVVVNGFWNASLVFRNNFDDSEIIGETRKCGIKLAIGSKICNTVKVKAEAKILAYSCRLEFPSNGRQDPKNPLFQNSKWTAEFNKNIVCHFPKIYLDAIPSDVALLCNNMPCGETASVNDTVTCMAHGYPQPVFNLSIRVVSAQQGNEPESGELDYESRFFMDTAEEETDEGSGEDTTEVEVKGYKDIRIGPTYVGQIEITCNVSNALGWGYNSMFLEVKLGLSKSETKQPGMPTFNLEDYKDWRKKHRISLMNYIAEVGTGVLILSPITPTPIGIRWFSQNIEGEIPRLTDKEGGLSNSTYLKKFHETYNTSWRYIFDYEKRGRWLKIKKVHLGFADVFRVCAEDSRTGNADRSSFDVAITLVTYEKHECGFVSKPQRLTEGETFVLNCSVIVNGLWNASLVFRNNYDESKTRGETSECGIQPNTGSKICSTVEVTAETDILSYSCYLEFPSNERQDPPNSMFQNSTWTNTFNKEVVCYLPQVYLDVIPSDVTFLCNNMPCEDTAFVNDTVTCVAYGYPQPVFDLRLQRFPAGHENKSKSRDFEVNYDTIFFMDTADEAQIRGSENYRISQRDVGQVEISCNVSNALGWGYNSLALEVKIGMPDSARNQSGTFHLEDYSYLLKDFKINVVNYVAEVGTDVLIMSPITPVPFDLHWFSRNMNGELPHVRSEELSPAMSSYFEEFLDTYNNSWGDVFSFDDLNRWLRIKDVQLGYADAYRVFMTGNMTTDLPFQQFDVTITLTIFEKHVCGFTSRPEKPKAGDTFLLSCSVIVNGFWDTYLVFRNNYDQSEIIGQTMKCGQQPVTGSKICSTVNVKAETDILAYTCRLEFFPSHRKEPSNVKFKASKWTSEFNKIYECHLPKVYLEAIPSDVSFLCNHMPCGDTALVNDTVTCLAHGYPQPVFDLRIQKQSEGFDNTTDIQDYENSDEYQLFMDTAGETKEVELKGSEDYRIKLKDVGVVEITCNVSNALGWGHNSLVLEVKLDEGKAETVSTERYPGASTHDPSIEDDPEQPDPFDTRETETDTTEPYGSGYEFGEGIVTPSKAAAAQISCNDVRCDANHTLFVDDTISCSGADSKNFDRFTLRVNANTTEGDSNGVRYTLQMADIGDVNVECVAHLSNGGVVVSSVPVIVRGNKTEQGEAAGGIDVGDAESIGGRRPEKPDSGEAAGKIEVPKREEGMSAEKSAGDDKSKKDIGSCGQESFVLLEIFLVFIGVLFGQVQF